MLRSLITITLFISTIFSQAMPFKVGEKLTYTLQFNIVKMGRGYLTVEEDTEISGKLSHHIVFEAKTSKFADRIFKVRDKIDIWLNQEDLTTLKVIKQIREGDYRKNYLTTFDYTNSIAITNKDTFYIDGKVRDPYSLLFYLRTIPLEVGQVLSFTTFDRKKSTDFQVIVDGKEKINTPAGTYNCKIVRPFREGKSLLKNSGDMVFWFSDDEKCIPIQIQIKLNFGSMILQLKKINS